MWIMTTTGFFSIVQNRFNPEDPTDMLVRSRSEDDINDFAERLMKLTGKEVQPWHSTTSDYPYRLTAHKDDVAKVVFEYANEIDYTNFKNAVKSYQHKDAYSDVWEVMFKHFYANAGII